MKTSQYLRHYIMWNFISKPLVHLCVKPSYHFFKTKDSDPFPKGPYILVANHGTFLDPWIIGSISSHALAIMTNDDGFRGKGPIQWYLKNVGAFPKKKGASDFKAMKTTIERLKSKYPVCIFPEGQTSWDGETQLLYRGIEKIARKMNVPIVTTHVRGNFLTKPWWAHTVRKGNISIDFRVIDTETIASLTDDELFDRIKKAIYQSDIKDERNREVAFTGKKLAKGLERFVWICMDCGCEDTLITDDNTITCTSCKKQWTIDEHCLLCSATESTKSLADLKDWSDMHRAKVLEITTSGKDFSTKTDAVSLSCENSEQLFDIVYGCGTLSMTRDVLTYTAKTGEVMKWDVSRIEDYVVQKKDIFEFRADEKIWRVEFHENSPMKWVMYFRYLKGFTECEARGYL